VLPVGSPTWHWRDSDTLAVLDPGRASVSFRDGRIHLEWQVTVAAGAPADVGWSLALHDAGAPMVAPATAPLAAPAVKDRRVGRLLNQSISDLNGLRMAAADRPDATFLAAGAPWFFTMFGRDSLIAARMLLPVSTELAGTTLTALAARQGTVSDPETAEQPGKILHEVRRGTLRFEEDGNGIALPPVYYGTIDATPLWILLLHDAWRAGLAREDVERLLDPLEKALAWLRDFGDSDGDGFLEYLDTTATALQTRAGRIPGLHPVARRSLADGPIALSEVQGYAYEAARGGADLLEAFGRPGAEEWRGYAGSLAAQFRESFWCSDASGRYPAIALDAQKRAVDGITSNMGHLLGTGILTADEEAAVVRRLLDPTMFSGFGIRTVSTTNGGFWPTRYHAGSVWSHDTGMIISGMSRAGFAAEAAVLARGLLDAAEGFGWRLPNSSRATQQPRSGFRCPIRRRAGRRPGRPHPPCRSPRPSGNSRPPSDRSGRASKPVEICDGAGANRPGPQRRSPVSTTRNRSSTTMVSSPTVKAGSRRKPRISAPCQKRSWSARHSPRSAWPSPSLRAWSQGTSPSGTCSTATVSITAAAFPAESTTR
jgi:hypothetical protein